jgi:hypothetical protein
LSGGEYGDGVLDMYRLLGKVSSVNDFGADKSLLDRVMFHSEALPPLGKEYWWFLFFDGSGDKPVQIMLVLYRKHGRRMLFNGVEMELGRTNGGEFLGVAGGWVFDGEKLVDLGEFNEIVRLGDGEIATRLADKEMMLHGGYPDYTLRIDDLIDLKMGRSEFLADNTARGVFIPPFGMGWVDIYTTAKGTVAGKPFDGSAHLQKVFGVTIYGPFHWGRFVFSDGSVASFFTLKTGKESSTFIHRSFALHHKASGEKIIFNNPRLEIGRRDGGWVVEAADADKKARIRLENYAEKTTTMKGGGSQVYTEYAVKVDEFRLEAGNRVINLKDLGRGVGTFENAYW